MKTLEQVLENISYSDSDHMNEMQLKKDIEKEMQGWTITTWDMDEYGNELTQSVADTIISFVQDGETDIQYGEWHTDTEDAYYAILASKTEDLKDKIIKNLTDEVFDLKQTINKLSNQIIEMQNKGE